MLRARDPKRPLLYGGAGLMAAGAALEVASRFRPPGGVFDTIAPWLVLAGSVLTLLYFAVRKAARAPEPNTRDSALFDPSTQMDDTTDRK